VGRDNRLWRDPRGLRLHLLIVLISPLAFHDLRAEEGRHGIGRYLAYHAVLVGLEPLRS